MARPYSQGCGNAWCGLFFPDSLHQHNSPEINMTKYVLLSFKTCPWVQRAAIVLREKNVDFEVLLIESDNRPDWFVTISPHNKAPVLRIDEKMSLFESNAIAEYLDETIAPRLHPEDPVARAINRAWTDFVPTFADVVIATAYADTEVEYLRAAEKSRCRLSGLRGRSRSRAAAPISTAQSTRWWMQPMRRSCSGTFLSIG
jgi:glutathione S-transferase